VIGDDEEEPWPGPDCEFGLNSRIFQQDGRVVGRIAWSGNSQHEPTWEFNQHLVLNPHTKLYVEGTDCYIETSPFGNHWRTPDETKELIGDGALGSRSLPIEIRS
jgi:hypothetical protein